MYTVGYDSKQTSGSLQFDDIGRAISAYKAFRMFAKYACLIVNVNGRGYFKARSSR